MDTVAAIATPKGEGAIGIIRLSGKDAITIGDQVFRGKQTLQNAPNHTMILGALVDESGTAFDQVLAVVMRGPNSFTGEDCVEIHGHGGRLLMERALQRVVAAGAKPAGPGEFTKRAFLNGRMDLTQAEAVIDLVRAKSPRGLAIAAEQLRGRLLHAAETDRQDLLGLLAHVQAEIDYPEEGLSGLSPTQLKDRLHAVSERVDRLRATAESGRIYREGMRLAIVGKPNVGKSSLLNALLQDDRAIVTPVPGTTRDVIEAAAAVDGQSVVLFDTAGLRTSDDPVEQIGVQRTQEVLRQVDGVIFVVDGSEPMTDEDVQAYQSAVKQADGRPIVVAVNKRDLTGKLSEQTLQTLVGDVPITAVSALNGEGLAELMRHVTASALGPDDDADQVVITRVRHRQALDQAAAALTRAQRAVKDQLPVDMIGADLEDALRALEELTGRAVTEELVERIFADFCVGK